MPEHVAQLLLNMVAVCNQPIRNAKVFFEFPDLQIAQMWICRTTPSHFKKFSQEIFFFI